MPVAVLVGAAFALKPATQLIVALLPLLNVMPIDAVSSQMQFLPQLQMIALGGMTFAAKVLASRNPKVLASRNPKVLAAVPKVGQLSLSLAAGSATVGQ